MSVELFNLSHCLRREVLVISFNKIPLMYVHYSIQVK